MKLALVVLCALTLLSLAAPLVEAGPPIIMRCELKWADFASYQDPLSGEWKDVRTPYDYECYY